MKKTLILAAVAAFTLSSCSKDTPTNGVDQASAGNEISFRTTLNKSDVDTKATFANTTVNNFTLYAKKWSTNKAGVGYAGFDFMNFFNVARVQNTSQTAGGDRYVYYPTKHYPTGVTGEGVSFFAYSPAGSICINSSVSPTAVAGGNGTATVANGAQAKMMFDYTVPTAFLENDTNQEDFLYAGTKQSSGVINLNFKHALSAISFEATNTSAATGFIIYKIEMLGFDNIGRLTITPSLVEANANATGSWSNNTDFLGTNYTVVFPNGGIFIPPTTFPASSTVSFLSGNEQLLILPQDFTDRRGGAGSATNALPTDLDAKSYVAITYSSFDGDMLLTHDHAIKYLPMPTSAAYATGFDPNYKYKFQYTFTAAETGLDIKIASIGVTPWETWVTP